MKINIQVEGLKALQQKLQDTSGKLRNLQPFWHIIGEYMKRRTIKECFDKEQAPDGTKWQPLSPTTIKLRMKRHKSGNMKILQDTGELRRSVKYKAFPKYVIIGSNLKYSRIHQFGGTIHSKQFRTSKKDYSHYIVKRSINIPARPYLGITEQDRQYILKTFQAYINRHVLGSI